MPWLVSFAMEISSLQLLRKSASTTSEREEVNYRQKSLM